MEIISEYLQDNVTLKAMLLKGFDDYTFKTASLESIRLDTGLSKEFIYLNYHKILQLAKQD